VSASLDAGVWRRGLVLFTVALACRLAFMAPGLIDPARLLVPPDSAEYVALARNLDAGHGFSEDAGPPYRPDIRRTPVYPVLLAAVFRLPNAGLRAAAVAGALAGSLTVVVTWRLAAAVLGSEGALVAALLLALDSSSVAYDVVILTEALFTLLIAAAALFLQRRPSRRRALAAAVLLAAAILCRPIGILLPLALAPVVVWRAGRTGGVRQAVLVNAVAGAAVGAWILRNTLVAGVVTFTSIGAVNLYFHRAAAIEARIDGRDVETVRGEWEQRFEAANASRSPRAQVRTLIRAGWAVISAHPLVYAEAYAAGLLRMAGPDKEALGHVIGSARAHRGVRWLVGLAAVQLAAVYAAALAGLWGLATRRLAPAALALPLVFIGYFIVTAGPEVYPRFRVPMMPFVVMMRGAGWTALREKNLKNPENPANRANPVNQRTPRTV